MSADRYPARTIVRMVAPLVIGLVGGLVVVRFHERASKSSPSTEVPVASAETDRERGMAAADRFRLAALERQMAALGTTNERVPHAAPTPERVAADHPGPEERAKRIKADYDYHQKLLSDNATAARNDAWAAPMEATVTNAFAKVLSGTKLKFDGVDCRSTSCAVNLSWPSRQAATAELRLVMSMLAGTRCSREVALPPEDQTTGPMHVSVVVQCST
jgi:hypothetical protein